MDSADLTPASSGFVLAAAITVLLNTVLACAIMKSVAGHDWPTQGLFDLVLFAGMGLIFTYTGIGEKIEPNRLIAALIGAVVIAGLGLALWFGFT